MTTLTIRENTTNGYKVEVLAILSTGKEVYTELGYRDGITSASSWAEVEQTIGAYLAARNIKVLRRNVRKVQ